MSCSFPPAEGRQWYAVHTKTHQEQRAAANIQSLGIETLLPRAGDAHARDGAAKSGVRGQAFFPGYLFVKCDLGDEGRKIRYTRGVLTIVGTPNGAMPVDPSVIDLIRSRMGGDGVIQAARPLRIGDRVRITAGPLKNLVGILESPRNAADRVTVLLGTVNSLHAIVDEVRLQPA